MTHFFNIGEDTFAIATIILIIVVAIVSPFRKRISKLFRN